MKIIVASMNPVKIKTTLSGFDKVFPDVKKDIIGDSTPSGVSDQPLSEKETKLGAENRLNHIYEKYPDADFWVSLEAGLELQDNKYLSFGWVYVKHKDIVGKGRSASYFLPTKISKIINEGKELGEAIDILYSKFKSKHKGGAIGLLTNTILTRETLFLQSVIIALIPFMKR